MKYDRSLLFALRSRGARYHIGIAMALITVLPALALSYLLFIESRAGEVVLAGRPVIAGAMLLNIILGYLLLSKYPANIIRLRKYLQEMISGKLPDEVKLLSSMDDIDAIERSMNMLLTRLSSQVEKLESAYATLEREVRERRRAERLKDEFVSIVSHELRTPLAVTKEGISLVLDGIPGEINAKQAKVLAKAKSSIDRLTRIINDLLDISKIEAGKMTMHREQLDLCALIRTVAASFDTLAAQKRLRIELALPAADIRLFADEDRIMQVFTNLISNAIKHTYAGTVTVRAAETDRQVECSVEDTGLGIAEEDIPYLFDKFTQFGRKHGKGGGGTGLGLSIVKSIVETHGGSITAESVPGEGSRFIFVLPHVGPEDVLNSRIEEKIVRARRNESELVVFLFQVAAKEGAEEDEAVVTALRERMDNLKALVREPDLLAIRGGSQLALVAEANSIYASTIRERWSRQIAGVLGEGSGGIPVRLSCGYAVCPSQGSRAAELLDGAQNRLVAEDTWRDNGYLVGDQEALP